MKSTFLSPWLSLFGVTAIVMAIFNESADIDKVQLSFLFTNKYVTLSKWDVIFLVLAVVKTTMVIYIGSYASLYKMKWKGNLDNSIAFMMIMILKYYIPFFFLHVTTVDGYTFNDAMPFTDGLIKAMMFIAMIMDTISYLLSFTVKNVMIVRFSRWKFTVPFHREVIVISWIIWTLLTGSLVYKTFKRYHYEPKYITTTQ